VEVRGRWALVTGAAKRVGREIALELGRRGMHVAVHYHRSAAEAAETVAALAALGVEAVALGADLADARAVAELAAAAERRSGGIMVLVNSASTYVRTPFDALDEAAWAASLDTNLRAPFLLAWHLGRAMRSRGVGRIINLADWAVDRPYAGYLPYFVAKAGIVGLTKALAKELAPAVQVNAVAPGPVLLREAIRRATLLGRIGRPEDVARCVRFLAEEADYTTGAVYHVDGGRHVA
jgi:NAD(P)-dependent dehydrogenase (short-subunit alcohol dehydrogenase family)